MILLEVDPNLVRPGWTALVVVVLLGIVLVFLGRSMIKQFGRITVPIEDEADASSTDDAAGPPTESPTERTPPIPDLRAPTPTADLRAPTPDGGRAAPPDQR